MIVTDIDMVGKALYGPRYKDHLAKELGYASGRTIRRWLETGETHTPPPQDLPDKLKKLIEDRISELYLIKTQIKSGLTK